MKKYLIGTLVSVVTFITGIVLVFIFNTPKPLESNQLAPKVVQIVIETKPKELPLTPAYPEPEPEKNHRIKLLETGEFHGDEVQARSGETWLGLFPTEKGFELRSTELIVETVHDPIVDAPRRKSGKKVSVRGASEPIFMVKGATMLKRGAVPTIFSGETYLGNEKTVNLKLLDSSYQLQVVSNDPTPANYLLPNSKLLLTDGEDGEDSQTLFSITLPGDAGWTLFWAGDLDGDGKLDLYMDLNSHYNSAQYRLFLSTQASRGKLVKEVARFSITGC